MIKSQKGLTFPPLGFSFESKICFEALKSIVEALELIVEALESIYEVGYTFFGVFRLGLAGNEDIHQR
jgi:hypothetical protein